MDEKGEEEWGRDRMCVKLIRKFKKKKTHNNLSVFRILQYMNDR
jgi:pyruvate/oxaloacetate carboxyltransferase